MDIDAKHIDRVMPAGMDFEVEFHVSHPCWLIGVEPAPGANQLWVLHLHNCNEDGASVMAAHVSNLFKGKPGLMAKLTTCPHAQTTWEDIEWCKAMVIGEGPHDPRMRG